MNRRIWWMLGTLLLLLACGTDRQALKPVEGVYFQTGKPGLVVIEKIRSLLMDEGYSIESVSEESGTITCEPRKMLNGVLNEKIDDNSWPLQTKRSTLNHQIILAVQVGPDGSVKVKTGVYADDRTGSLNRKKSLELAKYYEKRIRRKLGLKP